MATAMPPAIPPRPSKSQDKGSNDGRAPPKVPPRPARHAERKISPDDRFAPSPLNEGFPKQPGTIRSPDDVGKFSSEPREAPDRPGSVTMPSLGEEGSEYAAVAEELREPEHPEQTRTVGGDMKLHAPKPSLPVQSAKQRVAAIAHIDSDKAASFGIGKSTADESPAVPPRRKSATSFLSSEADRDIDEEQGIPEIGQRVPMDPSCGDVQAPSPAPKALSPEKAGRYSRRGSAQGGDYHGLHGHGHVTDDKLEKAYYEKHPEEYQKEISRPYSDRQTDYSLSRNELNDIIRDTAEHGSGLGTSNHEGTPSEEAGYRAHEEFASRLASPRTASGAAKSGLRKEISSSNVSEREGQEAQDEDTIHVDEPQAFMDELPADEHDRAPILAEDEVAKHPPPFERHAAVEPSGTPIEREGATSRPTSQHSSRPASATLKSPSIPEFEVTRLENVQEYEPLFKDEGKKVDPPASPATERTSVPPRFPSKDVWEDAPSSAYQTAEVNTPDAGEAKPKRGGLPERYVPTPAQAFAKHQEELAEKESERLTGFVPRGEGKAASWMPPELAVPPEEPEKKVPAQQRFPSRDVWEDAPESHLHKTTVSSRQTPESPVEAPEVPLRPVRSVEKPAIPSRPRPRKAPSDEAKPKPAVSDKPKPVIPSRPVRNAALSPEAKEAKEAKEAPAPAPKPKPAVPSKPVGGKIAALQAGFMSDLNKRLQLGPHAPPKKEEPRTEEKEGEKEEKEKEVVKKPLSDARKGRARGPQRRAPARSTAPPVAAAGAVPAAAAPAKVEALSLAVSKTQVVWSVDPEDGDVLVGGEEEEEVPKTEVVEASPNVKEVEELPKPQIATAAPKAESPKAESPKAESPKAESPKRESPMLKALEENSPEAKSPEVESPEVESPEMDRPKAESFEREGPMMKSPDENSPEAKSPEVEGLKMDSPEMESAEAEIQADTSPVKSEPEVTKAESVEVEPLKEPLPKDESPREMSPVEGLPVGELPREESLRDQSLKEESPIGGSLDGKSPNRASSNGGSMNGNSPNEAVAKEEFTRDPSPKAELPNTSSPEKDSPKEDVPEVPALDESSSDEALLKADTPAMEPLETDVAKGEHVGELPAQAQGRSAQVIEGDIETSSVKET